MSIIHVVSSSSASAKPKLRLTTTTSDDIDSGTATAGIRLLTSGIIQTITVSVWSNKGFREWIFPLIGFDPADYECQLLKISGPTPAGPALVTWHDLSFNREWTVSSSAGFKSFVGTLEVREIALPSNATGAASAIMTVEGGGF